MEKPPIVTANDWAGLRCYTEARIALGRSGVSQPTGPQLAFQMAHARARDAVHVPLDLAQLEGELAEVGLRSLRLHTQAVDRAVYLQRPDLGRRLDPDSAALLKQWQRREETADIALVLADGLSSTAVQRHAVAVLEAVDRALAAEGLTRSPVCIVRQGRVAVGDEVGELLDCRAVVLLVGERPGLSSPDSLGIYYTWAPRVGLTDAARNCISNIRPAGISPEAAAERLLWLVKESMHRGLSGVELKDRSGEGKALEGSGGRNFLLD